jgi:uncharacterized membrane protein YcaP (DUF421 family)
VLSATASTQVLDWVWSGWSTLARISLVGAVAYLGLVLTLRVTGKRTLSKLNAFDFVVTVALGSVLASVVVSSEVALSDGLVALALLAGLQFAVAFTVSRWPQLHRLATSEPVVLVDHGRVLHAAMVDNRIAEDELAAALRKHGVADLAQVTCVVLETDGTFSVLQQSPTDDVLHGVRRPDA